MIEELLTGPEVSVLALVDKRSIYVLETAQDHKPVDDGDTGPMTGGMGAYSPTPVISAKVLEQVEREIDSRLWHHRSDSNGDGDEPLPDEVHALYAALEAGE